MFLCKRKVNVDVVSTVQNAEGRDTPVFVKGEIFHTIFISSSRTRNIWYREILTHLFVEKAYIHSFIHFIKFVYHSISSSA